MARTSTKRAPNKRRNAPKLTRDQIANDAIGFLPGVGAVQVMGRYLPGQRQVDRFVQGNPPRRKYRNPEDIEFLNDMAPMVSIGHIAFTPEGLEEFVRDGFVYHAYSNTPVFADGYRMGTPIEVLEDVAYENPARFNHIVRRLRNPGTTRRNPATASDALYEEFHGEPPSETLAITEQFHVHGHLAGLGDLVMIQIRLMGGTKDGALATINAPDPQGAPSDQIVHVASNEDRNQMFLVGGDQDIDLKSLGFRESFTVVHDGEEFEATDIKDHMILGEIQRLDYITEKKFDKFESISYFHVIGEDTKVRPFLAYEPLSRHMSIYGGEYSIHAAGIVN